MLNGSIDIHARWGSLDFAGIERSLQAIFGTRPLTLLHAQGNLIWTDGEAVYKLTDPKVCKRAQTSLVAVQAILAVDATFPTIPPLSEEVIDLDLGPLGRWAVTIWEYREAFPFSPGPEDTHSYRYLGETLRRLHKIVIPGLSRHDPLQWTAERVKHLSSVRGMTHLEDHVASLSQRYADLFSADEDVTVHGDMHWHQTVMTTGGEILLLDFENAALGHPSVDLFPSGGWIRRTGFPSAAQMAALKVGYGDEWVSQTPAQQALSVEIADFAIETWRLNSS